MNTSRTPIWLPRAIIEHAIWLCLLLTLSLREVEELPAERGVVASHETIRLRVLASGR